MIKRLEEIGEEKEMKRGTGTTPLDLVRMMGGKGHRVGGGKERPVDAMLAVYKDRMTYTFILDGEVSSIHFDGGKGEIFFKGHNIRNLELSDAQRNSLIFLKDVLESDEEGKKILPAYEATLSRSIADK